VVAGATTAAQVPFMAANDQVDVDNALGWDNVNKRLGVGTLTPEVALTVYQGNAGAVAAQAGTQLLVEDDATAYIGMLVPAANTCGLLFGDNADSDIGSIKYDHSSDLMAFTVATVERLGIVGGTVYVNRGTSGGTPVVAGDDFVVEAAGAVGMSLLMPSTNVASILVGTDLDADKFRIQFDDAASDIEFFIAGAGTMFRITLNGYVEIVGFPLRLGVAAVASNVADQLVYGNAAYDMHLSVQDSAGTTYYFPCTTTNPA
jgi:hypothetical protein